MKRDRTSMRSQFVDDNMSDRIGCNTKTERYDARSEAFSGCHAGRHGKLYSRRFLGIFRLEQQNSGRSAISVAAIRSIGEPFATEAAKDSYWRSP
jgi:hypothetical protein